MFLNGSLTDTVPVSFAKSSVINKRASLTEYFFAELFGERYGAIIVFHVAHMWIQNSVKLLDRCWKILMNSSQL